MNNIQAVTSFSPEGEKVYGQRFVESFLEHFDWPLTVVYEGKDPAPPPADNTRDLLADEGYQLMQQNLRSAPEPARTSSYRYGVAKWCKKVMALTSEPRDTDWLVWIDADVIVHSSPSPDWVERVLPDDKALVYLGRRHRTASECGFVGYNLRVSAVRQLLDDFREMYLTGEVYGLAEWHDSYVFDFLRRKLTDPAGWHDLSAGIEHFNVWPRSILGEVMNHLKGPRRKMKAYGAVP